MLRQGFPDIHYTVEDMIGEGDRLVARWSTKGTHKGEFMGIPPTGRSVAFSGIEIVRMVGDKAVEEFDRLRLMQQLTT